MTQKSSMCETHFLLNCRLCNEDLPLPAYSREEFKSTVEVAVEKTKQELLIVEPSLPLDPSDPGPQPPPVSSPEAVKVTNITEEYARSCDKYEEACTAVNKTEEHIQNMREILEELIKARETARMMKTALKKKVLETLAGEE